MTEHARIIDHFIRRLNAGWSRSPMLRVNVTRRGRLLDCAGLDFVRKGLSTQVLEGVIGKRSAVAFTLRLRDEAGQRLLGLLDEATEEERPLLSLYDLLDRRMRRDGELAKRETGLHALWLGYPLLHVHGNLDEEDQKMLAPVFLWPIQIALDLQREGRITIAHLSGDVAPRLNLVMSTWVKDKLQVDLPSLEEDELEDLDWASVDVYLKEVTARLQGCNNIDRTASLEKIPPLKALKAIDAPHIYHAAVIGFMRQQHESLILDLQRMKSMSAIEGVASHFVSGESQAPPTKQEAPPEEDRYLVTDADFSQEQVVWAARRDPGVVVHGPPGTGKSQTIVNIIADCLAHGQTVLMVCQKQAAIQVVIERLKGVGLDDLCMVVQDTHTDRVPVFKKIREQLRILEQDYGPRSHSDHNPTHTWKRTRSALASKIERIEGKLDRYHQALYQQDDSIGLSYRKILARQAKLCKRFPNLQPLAGLDELLRNLSTENADNLLDPVATAGYLFAQAQPFTNIWRFRSRSVEPSPSFISRLERWLAQIAEQDERCLRRIEDIEKDLAEAERWYQEEKAFVEHADRVRQGAETTLRSVIGTHQALVLKLARAESLCYANIRPLSGFPEALQEILDLISDGPSDVALLAASLPELEKEEGRIADQMARLHLQEPLDEALSPVGAAREPASGSDGPEPAGRAFLEQTASGDVLSSRLTAFARHALPLMSRVRSVVETPGIFSKMAERWLRKADVLDLADAKRRCAEVVQLAERLKDYPVDEGWSKICSGIGEADLQHLGEHVKRLLDRRGSFLRRLGSQYRASKREVLRWRPEMRGPKILTLMISALRGIRASKRMSFWWHMATLHRYLEARALRRTLDAELETLVPGLKPQERNDEVRSKYAQAAANSLTWVLWLREMQQQQPWLGLVADCLRFGRPNEIAGLLKQVEYSAEQLERLQLALAQWFFDARDAIARYVEASDRLAAHRHIIEPALDHRIATARSESSAHRADVMAEMSGALERLSAYLSAEAFETPKQLISAGRSIQCWCRQVRADADRLDALIAYDSHRSQLDEHESAMVDGLEAYEQMLRNGDVDVPEAPNIAEDKRGEWWKALVEITILREWAAVFHERCPDLIAMDPKQREDRVLELTKALEAKRNLEVESIREICRLRQLPSLDAPWKTITQMKGSRYRSAVRLREAVELGIPKGLLDLHPCWLTNPLTASRLFPLEKGLFDVVIFDEASQCPPEQALSVIYRGKRLVVAGDEKQLPPTSYFVSNIGLGDEDDTTKADEDDEEATDNIVRRLRERGEEFLLETDNLLETAAAIIPDEYLTVHYRSEHPALIEYSNRAFYGGRLEMPLARADAREDAPPIEYHFVGGTYWPKPHRQNRDEARKVVDILRQLWRESERVPTVGVVTFNQPQRQLIEDFIEEACTEDRAFAACYEKQQGRKKGEQDIGFFVKNLENVQGDERDIMIFSTTFGKDDTGHFRHRFGPVGMEGGERRLNVAVTRAKQKVIVVSSMPINEVAAALATRGVGAGYTPAGYLQLYLAYAEAVARGDKDQVQSILSRLGEAPGTVGPVGEPESGLEVEVKQAIEEMGFPADPQVGESGFRIDIGVRHPDNPQGGYVLGVECDGATYHSSLSARARDVWREGILRSRGWSIYRVWSTRWWRYEAEERAKLRRAIEAAVAQAKS